MRGPRRILVVALALVACGTARAAARCKSTDECLRAIEAAQHDTQTLRARFVQTKHLSLLAEPLVSRGRFAWQRPNRVRWHMEEPQPASIVIDERGLHMPGLSERDRQALALAPVGEFFARLQGLFTGSLQELQPHFDVQASGDDAAVTARLVPRDDAGRRMFRAITLRFAYPLLLVEQIELTDALGDRLEIRLHEIERNVDLPASTFAVEAQ